MDPKTPVETHASPGIGRAATSSRADLHSHPLTATSREASSSDKSVVGLTGALDMLGIKRSTFYALVKAGDIAKPIRISARRVVWLRAELQSYLAEKIKARDHA